MLLKIRLGVLVLFCLMLNFSEYKVFALDNQKYDATYGKGNQSICVATGSPGSLGLLKALAEPFCSTHKCRVNWINMGSGESLEALKSGKVDMVMTHSPDAEKKAVAEGWAKARTLLGCNDFYILGPESDPAGISKATTAIEAYRMVARSQVKFFSRGDNSGTHRKEIAVWEIAGIKPAGSWYIVTNDFMGPTLKRADNELGYFMVDSSTYIAEASKIKNLKVLFKGDPVLVNVYHGLVASEKKRPSVNCSLAVKFLEFMGSPEGQKIFKEYGKNEFGTALYNDAEVATTWDN
ncbi:putative ABC transporter substrate binding protein [uncultured Desulfobacterium sp.]|uniref:Putative ABC transporter substrate binding protein n=1 Tax=uncultured Desulfobacterium sp. TaxID=201089 RepID=A0A445N1B9_9BACT|nr:putative ABC transporter substrate binding protein [uncultured Desulfobacterium sp.]